MPLGGTGSPLLWIGSGRYISCLQLSMGLG